MKKTLALICVILLNSYFTFSQSFLETNDKLPSLINSQSLDWGDYDNDGDIDLIISGQLETPELLPIFCIFRNDNACFTKVILDIKPLYYSFNRWIDYDNDDDLDFLCSGQQHHGSDPLTLLYINDNGVFLESEFKILESGYLTCGDYNNDSYMDFALIGRYGQGPGFSIYRNDSSIFKKVQTTIEGLGFATASFGDYDNDKDLDLVISGQTSEIAEYRLLVYKNDSNDVFTKTNNSFENINGFVSWGDYDNDMKLDLLVSGNHNYNEPITKIYRNIGNDQFVNSNLLLPQISGKSLFFDYDNDKDNDIIIAGFLGKYPDTKNVLRILNNNNSVFNELDLNINQSGDVAVTDYDNDGDIDFVISGPDKLNDGVYSTKIFNNKFIKSLNNYTYSESFYGSCNGDLKSNNDNPKVLIQDDSIFIYDTFEHHCCPMFSMKISEIVNDSIAVLFQDTSLLKCDCICNYDVKLNIGKYSSDKLKVFYNGQWFDISNTFTNRQTFAPIGAKWYYSGSAGGMAPTGSEYYLYESELDTIVANHQCKKISITHYKYQNGDTAYLPPVFVFQSIDTVYYYNSIYAQYFPLYIFNVSQGDTLIYHSPVIPNNPSDTIWKAIVNKVDSLIIGSDTLQRVWTTDIGSFSFWGSYTEKIGSPNLMFHESKYAIPEGDGPMRCYSDNSISYNFSSKACDFRIINSIKNLQSNFDVNLYPNPVKDILHLQIRNFEIINFKIYNSIGKQVKSGVLLNGLSTIHISELNNGYYSIELKADNKIERQPFVILK